MQYFWPRLAWALEASAYVSIRALFKKQRAPVCARLSAWLHWCCVAWGSLLILSEPVSSAGGL